MTPRRLEALYGWLFISPVIVALVVFSLGPIIASLYVSVMKTTMITFDGFVGFKNYEELLTKDPLFWQSLKVSFLYAMGTVPISTALQLILAAALNRGIKGISVFRLLYYMPAITPSVALIIVWMYILDPVSGLANMALQAMGFPRQLWLQSINQALPCFIMIAIWGSIGPGMILFLAGLQGISQSYYEAAELDGAGTLAKFWHITVPLVSPVTFFSVVLGVINALQVFDSIFIATRGDGSPLYTTLTIGLYIYRNAFLRLRFGYAAAVAWALALLIFVLTFIQIRAQKKWVYYGG
jgi:multiple sugar transport system permease protein